MLKSRPSTARTAKRSSSLNSRSTRNVVQVSQDFLIVGIGASAGGLEASKKLVSAISSTIGTAFILVQHLDPTHESMMVDLLSAHTPLTVRQATNDTTIKPGCLYVIPPGAYLSVVNGKLHLSRPEAHHGQRLPFDFLLRSLADECGQRAVCIVLSGTGADGSLGLKAIKEKGGLVIAQDPDEAGYDGMPRNAIMTGSVDFVLPVAKIPQTLIEYGQRRALAIVQSNVHPQGMPQNWLPEIIELLHTKTVHDFRLYKQGTLQRRVERRMTMAGIDIGNMNRYLEVLRSNTAELDLLAKDLLINVTSFFRDPKVFDFLAEKIIPDLVASHTADRPLRIWVAGCSTGEETYSLAMLFREAITEAKRNVKLQIFASDADPDAVASARDGLYAETIEADISTARLARFFSKDDHGYRISPEIRASVVFTVQDLLSDPPFSRIDLISCRNLLIYLGPEAQAKVVSLFHFALREGGILLLGRAETIGTPDDRFEVISKPARLYRHIGRSLPGNFGSSMGVDNAVRFRARPVPGQTLPLQADFADLSRRFLVETYAPAAVLINRKFECLYSSGPIDRYLHVPPEQPTRDLLAMVPHGMRAKLRSTIQQVSQEKTRKLVAGGRVTLNGQIVSFNLDIRLVPSEGDELLSVCFVDEPEPAPKQARPSTSKSVSGGRDLERQLDATRMELQNAVRNLEISSQEQNAVNEEALSLNEEYQSTNEELETSKEELQSLNEELTALNGQLQETLEGQRTTSNDLQNVLYSTDVATLFLDLKLNIRFFTPMTKSFFRIVPGDVGRPLADLNSLASDVTLLSDAKTVLHQMAPLEREIESPNGSWFIRRILPYRTNDNKVQGVVITFTDITELKHAATALETAKQQADQANTTKSRFLAAASHDLRQPLQTLSLLQGLLAKSAQDETSQKLVRRLDETLGTVSGMLNTLLDINQIETGTVQVDIADFKVEEILARLKDEYSYLAQAQGLTFSVVLCGCSIRSDRRLLEQMIRNLLSNALKYTKHGHVLLGCRRHGEILSIEVWDTGIGIPPAEQQAIFEEYHQIDNAARERSRGLGLGLSIVQRLGNFLGHQVNVRSQMGKGSVFNVEVPLSPNKVMERVVKNLAHLRAAVAEGTHRTGVILIVEDDPSVRELLELVLREDGHQTSSAPDGIAALELIKNGSICPDLIIADYNLPNGLNGLQLTAKAREIFHSKIPTIVLTGDISIDTLQQIAHQDCMHLNKPVKVVQLKQAIQELLPPGSPTLAKYAGQPTSAAVSQDQPTIFIVDDDHSLRAALRSLLEKDGRIVEDYATGEAFIAAYYPRREACLLIDAYLPRLTGIEVLQKLHMRGHKIPAIMITGSSDVPMAVQAMKAGASDFIEKPVGSTELLASIDHALERSRDLSKLTAWRRLAAHRLIGLTARQRKIMDLILEGHPNKIIAADLGISQRTVESHRAQIMNKTGSKSLPELARLAQAAAQEAG